MTSCPWPPRLVRWQSEIRIINLNKQMLVKLLFLIGQPNSGKSTLAQRLAQQPFTYVISPGDWLRELKNQGSDLGQFIFHNWSHEALNPLVIQYLDQTVGAHVNNALQNKNVVNLIIDGYPRTVSEAVSIARIARGNPVRVIQLCVEEAVLKSRGTKRKRADDDTEAVMDIRMSAYRDNIDAIKRELTYSHIDYMEIISDENTLSLLSSINSRIAIPPSKVRRQIARKMLTQVGAIERATIFQQCLRLAKSTRMKQQFIGSHPISLTRKELPRIRRFPYLVSLKATGIRFLCLIHNKYVWFISRSMEVFAGLRHDNLEKFEGTLLDGELIGEEEASDYLVLDCITHCGISCRSEPILERLRLSMELVSFMAKGPLQFHTQQYCDRTQLENLMRSSTNLKWDVDGIIFQPAKLPYRLGIDYNMFKWKPLGENTVDFYYHQEGDLLLCRYTSNEPTEPSKVIERGNLKLLIMGRLLPKVKEHCSWIRDGMIVECVALPEEAFDDLDIELPREWQDDELVWFPQRHRGDKLFSNFDWVAKSVISSIIDNITQDEIMLQCRMGNLKEEELPLESIPYRRNVIRAPQSAS